MKLLHIVVGAFVLLAFLLTGQYMDYLDIRSGALGDATRMMFRSRHIYILLAGLVNLAVGTLLQAFSGVRAGRASGEPKQKQSEVELTD